MPYQPGLEYQRTNVWVNEGFDEDGAMVPRKIYWRDGREFDLQVTSKQPRPALKVGGCGIRYTVRVTYLFFGDRAKPETWFAEERLPFSG